MSLYEEKEYKENFEYLKKIQASLHEKDIFSLIEETLVCHEWHQLCLLVETKQSSILMIQDINDKLDVTIVCKHPEYGTPYGEKGMTFNSHWSNTNIVVNHIIEIMNNNALPKEKCFKNLDEYYKACQS